MELHIPEPNQADQCLLCPGTPWPIPARATGIYSRGRRGGTLQWQKEALQEKQKLSVHGCSAASVTPGKETHGTCSSLPPEQVTWETTGRSSTLVWRALF